ncbi:MAG: hypoxanthine phosphoribosyltransferase [Chloroflexi bacterium]|nr:MAG: hypoxanthine phosphoribosyltransferase [Phototrophicales bacterium]RMF80360.1 MAG: hypoxanthine phosphoribosyltransferase [Chloroflexota bacterium]
MSAGYEKFLQEILIDEQTLQARVKELGQQISADYADCDDLLLICILKGGVVFLADLTRYMTVPHEIDFLAVSSYGKGARESRGHVRIDMDLTEEITGRHVLIVEDIIDSGHTLRFVLDVLQARDPASLRLVTLMDKPVRRTVDIPIDYVGFEIENKFVFGYGLDLDEKFRNLPFVGVVNLESLPEDV